MNLFLLSSESIFDEVKDTDKREQYKINMNIFLLSSEKEHLSRNKADWA